MDLRVYLHGLVVRLEQIYAFKIKIRLIASSFKRKFKSFKWKNFNMTLSMTSTANYKDN